MRCESELSQLFNLINSGHCYCIDGYPRSGNTYYLEIAKTFCRAYWGLEMNRHCIHHYHEPSLLRFLSKKEIPIILLMRNPRECIISMMRYELSSANSDPSAYTSSHLIHLCERESHRWMRFFELYDTHRKHDSIHLSRFDLFIESPSIVIQDLVTAFRLDPSVLTQPPKRIENRKFDNQFFQERVIKISKEESPLRNSGPSAIEEKRRFDQPIIETVAKTACFHEALAAYNSLL